jgi:hypothetical protein
MPTEQWMNKIVETITPVHLKKRLEEDREVDFSYYIPEVGRFRTNLFQQRGQWALAMRYVKSRVASFEELGLLEQIKTIAQEPRGIVLWPAPPAPASPRRSPRWSNTSTPISNGTSSRWKTRLNLCSRTISRSSNSAKSAWTRSRFITR